MSKIFNLSNTLSNAENHLLSKFILPAPILGIVTTQSNEDNYRSYLGKSPVQIVKGMNGDYYLALYSGNFKGIAKLDKKTNKLSIITGDAAAGFADGNSLTARFQVIKSIAYNPVEEALYVADRDNSRIRRVDLRTLNTTTVIGNGTSTSVDGVGTAATTRLPTGICIDVDNQIGYFTERNSPNSKVRKFSIPGYTVETVTPVSSLQFNEIRILKGTPWSYLYIATDFGLARVAVGLNAPNTVVPLIPNNSAGYVDGAFSTAKFNGMKYFDLSLTERCLYASEDGNRIRKIDLINQVVTTIAGDVSASAGAFGFVNARGSAARFNAPQGVLVDDSGALLVCDNISNAIRRVY